MNFKQIVFFINVALLRLTINLNKIKLFNFVSKYIFILYSLFNNFYSFSQYLR